MGKAWSLQDRVQADDLVKMLFSPEELDLPQEQPPETQQDPAPPAEVSKDEL